jgi:hypothetical protein
LPEGSKLHPELLLVTNIEGKMMFDIGVLPLAANSKPRSRSPLSNGLMLLPEFAESIHRQFVELRPP